MRFNVYTRPDGAFLLFPDCMTASREAEALHGPLAFCDTIESDAYPLPALWDRVAAEIDELSFAILQEAVGRQMLGIDCEDHRATA